MIQRNFLKSTRRATSSLPQSSSSFVVSSRRIPLLHHTLPLLRTSRTNSRPQQPYSIVQHPTSYKFSTSTSRPAQPASADALIEDITELYGTARDEFEIAAEETEKKTVYAAEDRAAAQEAFKTLKDAYGKALSEGGPEVAKEVQGRIGQRIRELEKAMIALEESALED